MQDGYTQSGAGDSDMRVGGNDLQHNRQTRTADEWHVPVRMVRQESQSGGPMHEHTHPLQHMLANEMKQHAGSKEHMQHHLEMHHKRPHDSQYGHDKIRHHYAHEHGMV